MLDFFFNRRDFLRVGSIGAGMTAIGLSDLAMAQDSLSLQDKAVVWVWLGGGPTQFETFHAPNDTVPTEWQPVNGAIHDSKTNITLGADWTRPKLSIPIYITGSSLSASSGFNMYLWSVAINKPSTLNMSTRPEYSS